jgi:hypothetical protein
MIIGEPEVFAIESKISKAYVGLGLRALGLFVIHVGGKRYGVYESDATMLANSLDEVARRLKDRGLHIAPFACEPHGGEIADAFRNARFADEQKESFFGIKLDDFVQVLGLNNLVWAPDGDEAFDDGSYVLQFDVGDQVRLIAFKFGSDFLHDPRTIRDLWIAADRYYSVLERWLEAFEAEWKGWLKEDA